MVAEGAGKVFGLEFQMSEIPKPVGSCPVMRMSNADQAGPSRPHARADTRDDDMVAFGPYQLFPRLRLLLKEGVRLKLGDRALDVLIQLVGAAGKPLSKDALLARIWPKEAVEENSLQAQISSLRKILGADRDLIATEFGRGYRFTGSIQSHRAVTASFAASPGRSGLPRPRSPLVGRARELQELNRLLATRRLLTLAGPAGVGKTRLAIEVASASSRCFPDGVYFADLSQLGNASSVVAVLSSVLAGFSATGAPLAPERRAALLLVDNCEHLASACADAIEPLLQAEHALNILLTSQTPLGLDGEQVYRIRPLAVPPPSSAAARAREYSAVELFVRRVMAADYHFELTEKKLAQIAAICRALDGIPLALEIAAARVPSLGLAAITQDLALSSEWPAAAAGRNAARHRTLGDAMKWSYRLLNPAEQTTFQELAIFPGDFTLPDAQQLVSLQPGHAPRLLDVIYGLAEKSLITLQAGTRPGRYRYLSMLRAYALEQLGSRADSLAEKHAHFVDRRVSQAQRDWTSLPTTQWGRQYEHHIDDIRSALSWAFQAGHDRPLGLRILARSAPFWIQLSLHDECRQRITAALEKVEDPSMEAHQEMMIQAALATSLTWSRGPLPANGQAWARTAALALRLGDQEMRLQAEYGLWLFHLRGGRNAQALQHGRAMADLATEFGDQDALLTARRLIGTAYHFLGRHAEALLEIESMLEAYVRDTPQGSNFRFGLDQRVAGWAFLARIHCLMGNASEARRAAQLAIDEATALDHACSLCCALVEGSCTVAALSGDAQEVLRVSQQLNQAAARHGLHFWALYGAAFALWARVVQTPLAVSFSELQATLHRLQSHGFDPAYSVFLPDFAGAMIEQGHSREARELIDTRLGREADAGQHWNAPELMRVKARALQHDAASRSAAAALLQQALQLAQTQRAQAWQTRLAAH